MSRLASIFLAVATCLAGADAKTYTLVLKDEVPLSPRARGEQSTVSWEADFSAAVAAGGETQVRLRWRDFRAMYRGREVRDGAELDRAAVKRVGIMCRR